MKLPVRRSSLRYEVVIDATLDTRGITKLTTPGVYEPAQIVLREWDGEVLLHECLHALLHEGGMRATTSPNGTTSVYVADEEDLVSHISHGLYEMGWRLVPEKQSEATL